MSRCDMARVPQLLTHRRIDRAGRPRHVERDRDRETLPFPLQLNERIKRRTFRWVDPDHAKVAEEITFNA